MIIEGYDLIQDASTRLTASITTEHPASSYGQPVMLIEEWGGDVMSHSNFILIGARVIEISDQEIGAFRQWHQMIDAMACPK